MAEIGYQIVGWLIVLVVFWLAAHILPIRWLIERLEGAVGRRFFPFIDRIFEHFGIYR